jgi:voltage-gated potassium channel
VARQIPKTLVDRDAIRRLSNERQSVPIYRVFEPRTSRRRVQEWRRRVAHIACLLLLTVAVCAIGMIVLDSTDRPLPAKMFRGIWNAFNLVTTLGDFTVLGRNEEIFMMVTMCAFLTIGGYALSTLTGMLSSDAVMTMRENKIMKQSLDGLANHVIVIGFGTLGRLVAGRLREAGEHVVVVDRTAVLAAQASDLGYLVVQGDAGVDDAVLDHSGVERAKALVVTTEDPDRKISITLMAHASNSKLKIAVAGRDSPRGRLLHRAGASEVVITDNLIADALVDRLGTGTKA